MNQRENAFASENLGWRLETIVLTHLLRRCKIDDTDIYYWNDRTAECDFLVCKGNKVIQCIQVSYDISNEKTRKREIRGLLHVSQKTNCDNLLLLTDYLYEDLQIDGKHISIQPVHQWTLSYLQFP